MCGIGKCDFCGDNSYECGSLPGSCGCFNDFSGVVEDMSKIDKEKFMERAKKSKKWKFIKKHGL